MSQISAKIIADSISPQGKRITTFELEYPRFIHSELMTHRVFSRSAMSSRAVPIEKMIEQVRTDYASPVHWGKNQAGMQAKEQLEGQALNLMQTFWRDAAIIASEIAEDMDKVGGHKQISNRILEPFQTMKTVLTATEFENFFWLRNHADAQPEIKKLAELMLKAIEESEPLELKLGDWHLPYFETSFWDADWSELVINGVKYSLEDAKAISASCCAQVSYRKLDDSLEKALKVYERLVESEPVHASPFEHQATPMQFRYGADLWEAAKKAGIDEPLFEEGTTHMDYVGNFWSGNFCGWIQHRQLIPNNVKKG